MSGGDVQSDEIGRVARAVASATVRVPVGEMAKAPEVFPAVMEKAKASFSSSMAVRCRRWFRSERCAVG